MPLVNDKKKPSKPCVSKKKIKKPIYLVPAMLSMCGCSALQGLLGGGSTTPASAPASTDQSVHYTLTSSNGLQVDATLTIKAASAPSK